MSSAAEVCAEGFFVPKTAPPPGNWRSFVRFRKISQMRQLLDYRAPREMLCSPDNQHLIEKLAVVGNLIFLQNDWWLANTAVIASAIYNNGGREVFVTFANYKIFSKKFFRPFFLGINPYP
jgi:hypothetical protein